MLIYLLIIRSCVLSSNEPIVLVACSLRELAIKFESYIKEYSDVESLDNPKWEQEVDDIKEGILVGEIEEYPDLMIAERLKLLKVRI